MPSPRCSFLLLNSRNIRKENQKFYLMEIHLEFHLKYLGGNDGHKIDYSAEAVKSRCVAENVISLEISID